MRLGKAEGGGGGEVRRGSVHWWELWGPQRLYRGWMRLQRVEWLHLLLVALVEQQLLLLVLRCKEELLLLPLLVHCGDHLLVLQLAGVVHLLLAPQPLLLRGHQLLQHGRGGWSGRLHRRRQVREEWRNRLRWDRIRRLRGSCVVLHHVVQVEGNGSVRCGAVLSARHRRSAQRCARLSGRSEGEVENRRLPSLQWLGHEMCGW